MAEISSDWSGQSDIPLAGANARLWRKSLTKSHFLIDRAGTRTQDQRIKSPPIKIRNHQEEKDLRPDAKPVGPHLATDTCQTDPDLARIVDAWPALPEAVRDSILMLVKAAAK